MRSLITLYRRTAAAHDAIHGKGAALREGIFVLTSVPGVIVLITLWCEVIVGSK